MGSIADNRRVLVIGACEPAKSTLFLSLKWEMGGRLVDADTVYK